MRTTRPPSGVRRIARYPPTPATMRTPPWTISASSWPRTCSRRHAHHGPQEREHDDPGDDRRSGADHETPPVDTRRPGDQRGVHAEARDEAGDGDLARSGLPQSGRHPVQVLRLVEPLRGCPKAVLPDQARPSVPGERSGKAARDRKRQVQPGVEAARPDQHAGRDQHQLSRHRKRDTCLFREEQAAQDDQSDRPVQALDEAHRSHPRRCVRAERRRTTPRPPALIRRPSRSTTPDQPPSDSRLRSRPWKGNAMRRGVWNRLSCRYSNSVGFCCDGVSLTWS